MKRFFSLVLIFIMALVLTACKKVTLTINEADKSIAIETGDEITVTPTVTEGYELEWTTSDQDIATVTPAKDSLSAVIEAVSAGSVTITVKVKDKDVSATISVAITNPAPTSVTITGAGNVAIGATLALSGSVNPIHATQTLTWTTTSAAIATVSATGVVTGVAEGSATIKATSVLTTVFAEVTVTVVKPDPTGITVSGPTSVVINENGTFTAAVAPVLASQAITWSTSDETKATITEEGVLTAIAVGAIKVRATSVDKTAVYGELDVTIVLPDPATITVTGDAEVLIAETATYTAAILPTLADQSVTWSTSDVSKATIDASTGVLTAVAAGSIEVIATSVAKNTIEGRLAVTIIAPDPESVTITGAAKMNLGDAPTYTVAVLPTPASQEVTWSTSDDTIATITQAGVLTTVKTGVVKVIATSKALDTIVGELEVTIYGLPTAITYAGPTEFVVGGLGTAKVAISAASGQVADQSLVTYTIDTPAVATINATTGVINALTAGNATVTATSTLNNTVIGTQLITVHAAEYVFPVTTKYVVANYADKESFVTSAYPGNFVIGYNAFSTLTAALAKAVAGDEITVLAGTYQENVTISISNLTIKGENAGISAYTLDGRKAESIIKGTITLGDVEGIIIDGLEIQGGQIKSTATLKDIQIKNVFFTDSSVPAAEGVVFFGLAATTDVNENVTITGCRFNDNLATGYRAVRINNAKNITITNSYFYGFFDTIRLESQSNGTTGDGVQGTVVISNNKFEMNVQYPIYLTVWSATSVEINHNYIAVDPAGVGTYGFIYLNNYVPKVDVKSVVFIQYNVFPTNTAWHEVRLNSKGATKAQLEFHVNFNEFNETPILDGGTTQCKHIADHNTIASDFLIDGTANIFTYTDEVKADYFLKTIYEPYYRSLEELDTLYVDDAWVGSVKYDVVTSGTTKYVYGLNAFGTITEALEAVKAGKDIYVLPGTYAEQVEITKVVNLFGPNATVNPVENDAAFLATSETAATITGVWYLNTVSDVEIKGFSFTGASRVRMFGPSGDTYGFVFQNNYVYDTANATLAWKGTAYSSYGITAINDALTPGFLNLVPYARWLHDFKIVNNKFVNVSDTNVFALCVAGITIEGNYFKDGDRDAIRLDYGSVYGDVNIKNNHFENIALNGIYFRSYTGTYTTALYANIHNNYFKNVGSNAATDASAKIAAISTRGYAEKKDAYFDIRYNVFEECYNYIALRANVTNTTTWATLGITWQAKIEYNAFIDADPVTYYFENTTNASDTAATNVDNVIINHNFYGTDANTKATITAAQFDLFKVAESNLVVYDTKALLDAAIVEAQLAALKASIAALSEGKTAEYPAASLDAFIAGHGFSGYTLTHNGKVLYIGSNAFISLRAMEGEETVLPWTVVQPYTVGEAALVNYGVTITGAVAAGASPTGTGVMYYNGNDTAVVVSSLQLYGYQGTAWGQGLYGVIRVDKNGLIQQNIPAADLATGVMVTLEPGDFLITSFQSDRTALGTSYATNPDFAVGQTVTITNHPELAYK